jgi:hypothetical protein
MTLKRTTAGLGFPRDSGLLDKNGIIVLGALAYGKL